MWAQRFLTIWRSPVTRRRPLTPAEMLDVSIAQRRAERLARPVPDEAKRFTRARPMLDRLRFEIASRQAQA